MQFFEKEIIMLFVPPQYILSDNDLKFDCKAIQDFARHFNIQCNHTSTFNHQGNGVVERIVGTLKKALQKVTGGESKECDVSLENVLYRYRRLPRPDGIAPFEILFGVKPRFAIEPYDAVPGKEVLTNARLCELEMSLIN